MDGVFAVVRQFWVQQAEAAGVAPNEVVLARVESKFSRMDPEAFAALADELGSYPSMVERLGEISCPTTVIVGEHDTGLRGAADVFAEHVPGANLVVIAGAGHSPQEDQPRAWLDAVQGHLARSDRDDADRPRPFGPTHRGQKASRRFGAVRRGRRNRPRRNVGGVRPLRGGPRRAARGRHHRRARRTGRDRRVHGHRSRPATAAGDGGRRQARPAAPRAGPRAVRRRAGGGRRRRHPCPCGRRSRARRSSRANRCRWSSTPSRDSSPARRCCSPSSGRTRPPAGPRRHAVHIGRQPRSWCVPASTTTASRRCRWSRTDVSSCPTAPTPTRTGLSVWASTQSVFGVRREIANMLGLDEDAVVVRAPAVGGGFGAKGGIYVEQLVVAALAARLGRAVAWVETRNENLLNMTHGRGQVHDVEVGARRDGTIVGLASARRRGRRCVSDPGRVHPDGDALHGLRHVSHPGDRVRRADRADQHDADRALSRRGPARSRGPRRADDGRARARARRRTRPRSGAATSSVPKRSRTAHRWAPCTTPATTTARSTEALHVSEYDHWRAEQVSAPRSGRSAAARHRHRLLRRSERPRRRVRLGHASARTGVRPW